MHRLSFALVFAPLVSLGCGEETVANLQGELQVQEPVDFGDVQVGLTVPFALKLENVGRAAVTITGIEVDAALCQDLR